MSSAEPVASLPYPPIRRLLIANRGEIARRILRSAHAMGMATVAVFADGDADAPFVREADVAVALDGRTPAESYLDVDKLLAAARRTEADAVHPGYGFLAENAVFAQAVLDAGLIWVGPPPAAIAAMGDKLAAKRLMTEVNVPILPSVEVTPDLDSAAAAADIGFPILVKASAGGGGKGMRVVTEPNDLADSIAGARREAASSFGDDTVFLEKYLPAPRHVEVQVLGDTHGSLVHLFERECSIQRRHQKIIEEAPSTALTPELRSAMGAAALEAVRAIDYSSAGTVEFLLDGDEFWFLEVNTRIQVEHPVTEAITGIDLIREQLRIAAGEPLGYGQGDLSMSGHAIEARLYAEDPANEFLPVIGTLEAFEMPETPAARVDTGVESGSVVGVDFDPMLAKVIVHAATRTEAANRLAKVLERMTVAGVVTNRDFLVSTLRHGAFLAGDTTTDFIEREQPARTGEVTDEQIGVAAIALALFIRHCERTVSDPLGFMSVGYRNSTMPPERHAFDLGERRAHVDLRSRRNGQVEAQAFLEEDPIGSARACRIVGVDGQAGEITVDIDGIRRQFRVVAGNDRAYVRGPDLSVDFAIRSRFPDPGAIEVAGGQTAPMPGKILAVEVAAGEQVAKGRTLIIMEAMKMEHTIVAPASGVVSELRCQVGDQVDNGQVLVVLEFDPD